MLVFVEIMVWMMMKIAIHSVCVDVHHQVIVIIVVTANVVVVAVVFIKHN